MIGDITMDKRKDGLFRVLVGKLTDECVVRFDCTANQLQVGIKKALKLFKDKQC